MKPFILNNYYLLPKSFFRDIEIAVESAGKKALYDALAAVLMQIFRIRNIKRPKKLARRTDPSMCSCRTLHVRDYLPFAKAPQS